MSGSKRKSKAHRKSLNQWVTSRWRCFIHDLNYNHFENVRFVPRTEIYLGTQNLQLFTLSHISFRDLWLLILIWVIWIIYLMKWLSRKKADNYNRVKKYFCHANLAVVFSVISTPSTPVDIENIPHIFEEIL